MPQVHSATPANTDMSVSASGKTQPGGADALFAGILARQQVPETGEIKADTDVPIQYIDEISKLIDEPIEEEYEASPEELLRQIGHCVSFNAELNKTPAQKINLSGESLPPDEVKAEDLSAAALRASVTPEQSVDGVSAAAATQTAPAPAAATSQAQSNTLRAAESAAAETAIDDARGTEPELIKPAPGKPALNTGSSQPEKDGGTVPAAQKSVDGQAAANVKVTAETNPADEVQAAAEGTESADKPAAKSSPQPGQTAPLFADHDRVEARGELPRFTVSLKRGLEQQVQMQDMIQRFAPVMRQQVTAMVSNGVGQAEIRLDPPELGHMMVRIQVQQDQTQVQFQVTNPAARELLEHATPRLRDMLAGQGMNLADSQISYHDGGGEQRGRRHGEAPSGSGGRGYCDAVSGAEEITLTNIAATRQTGIDYYA